MELLSRLTERPFLTVTEDQQWQFRNLLIKIETLKPIALAPYLTEPPEYRKEVKGLYILVSDVHKSLINYDRYREPFLYTAILEQLKKVIESINVSQPEAIFRMMNKLLIISKQLEKLIEILRS